MGTSPPGRALAGRGLGTSILGIPFLQAAEGRRDGWAVEQHAHETQVEVGLRLAPLSTNAPAFARELLEELDREGPQRTIVGLGAEGSRLIIVLSVALGTAEAVRAGDDCAREAVIYLDDFVQRRSAWDPALIGMPDSGSPDAIIAEHVRTQARAYGLGDGAVIVERKALKQAIHALAGIGVAGRA